MTTNMRAWLDGRRAKAQRRRQKKSRLSPNRNTLDFRRIMAESRPTPFIPAPLGGLGVRLLVVGRAARIVARTNGDLVIGVLFFGPLTLVLRWAGLQQLLSQCFVAR